jgi:hypothetical protein
MGQLEKSFWEYGIVKDLSDDLLENWGTTYSAIDYPPPKMFGGMPIDHELNWEVLFEKFDERPRIKALVVRFKEIFPYLSIDRIVLLYKRRKVMVFRNVTRTTHLVQGKLQSKL